jgi:hypothetical protein
MKLFFLPFVREGFTATAAGAPRARVQVSLQLDAPGNTPREVGRELPLLGPGDVLGLDPRQVLRVTPAAGTHDAEPEFFPAIEFDSPDLPWTYSPVVSTGPRALPWLVLIVIEARDGVTVLPGSRGQSPWILRMPAEVAARELPNLADSWAWTHAQVACETPAQIRDTLAGHPDRTLSRLLAPRRLLPLTAYHACVVPAFLSGRIAGLGEDPSGNAAIVTGQEPAWSANDRPTALPVYHTWSFRTGEAGDFESLAQRLRAAPLDATLPPTPLHLSLPAGDGNLVVDWQPPLRAPGAVASRPPRPAAATTVLRNALRPGTSSRPVLGPAYFGAPWTPDQPLTPATDWRVELNLTPMLRAAAGLGAEAVRIEQDAIVAAAAEQLEAFRAEQREGRRRQLVASFVGRVAQRLQRAPATERSRVLAPLAALQQQAASNVGLFTIAGRRMDRKAAKLAQSVASAAVRDRGDFVRDPARATPVSDEGLSARFIDAVAYRPTVLLEPVSPPQAPPAPADPVTIPTGAFAPRFGRPMSEPLAERYPELMVPDASGLAPDSVLVVESNDAFVESFLVGANQELHHELLWRGLPADPGATAFRRFWAHAGAPADASADDIDDITAWAPASRVGSHVNAGASMILLVRSELVRRYPSMLVALVPAEWKQGGRLPVTDATRMKLPVFRGRIGTDMLYAGFSGVPIVDAIGATTSEGAAGWFFLLSENPGDPRFGLDPPGISAPPTRSSLSWSHLNLPAGATYATADVFPAGPDAGFTPAAATAANLASLVRQRPFRAFLHASLLVRLPV